MGQHTEGTNSFAGGLISDLNAITTPPTVLTDCINGTLLTFNGNELVLQNDMGNTYLTDGNDKVKLSYGFVPIGVKEHGGIIYIVSYNNDTKETEIGSFPSPNYSSILEHNMNGDVDVVTGEELLENNISMLNKSIILSQKILNPGDPYLISIILDETEISKISYPGNRKYYVPKLISVGDNFELDITEDVEGSIQQYTTDGINFSNDSNNFWFLTKALALNTSFQQYLTADKVYYYQNKKPGKIAIKFILENIDLFNIHPDKYNNHFPSVKRSGTDPNFAYDLIFDKFDVTNPSQLKVTYITLKYTLTDITTNVIDPEVTMTFGPFTPVAGSGMGEITNGASPVFTISLTNVDPTLRRNKMIKYTIIPSNYEHDYIFTDYIISDQILNLNKSSLDWELNSIYKLDSVVNYMQKVNPYSNIEDYTLNLKPTPNILDPNGNPSAGDYENIFWSNNLLKPTWIKLNNSFDFNVNALVHVHMHAEPGHEVTFYDTFRISSDDLIGVGASHTVSGGLFGSTDDKDDNCIIPSIVKTDKTHYQLELYTHTHSSSTDNTYADPILTINNMTTIFPNLVGYRIYPLMKRISGTGEALSGGTLESEIVGVTDNSNVDLIKNNNFQDPSSESLNWTGASVQHSTTTSFKQNWAGFSMGYYISQNFSGNLLSPGYYILTLYAFGAYGFNVTIGDWAGGITTTADWKHYNMVVYISDNTNQNITISKYTPGSGGITNISLRRKLIQDSSIERKQAVCTYKEDINIVVDSTNSPILRQSGVYLPDSKYEMIENFVLDSTLTTSVPTSTGIPSVIIRK